MVVKNKRKAKQWRPTRVLRSEPKINKELKKAPVESDIIGDCNSLYPIVLNQTSRLYRNNLLYSYNYVYVQKVVKGRIKDDPPRKYLVGKRCYKHFYASPVPLNHRSIKDTIKFSYSGIGRAPNGEVYIAWDEEAWENKKKKAEEPKTYIERIIKGAVQ